GFGTLTTTNTEIASVHGLFPWQETTNKGQRTKDEGPGTTDNDSMAQLVEQLRPNIFQNVGGALHSHLAGQERVLVLNTQDAVVAYVHIRLHVILPQVCAVTVADGPEDH